LVTQLVPFKNLAPVQDKQVVASLQEKQLLEQALHVLSPGSSQNLSAPSQSVTQVELDLRYRAPVHDKQVEAEEQVKQLLVHGLHLLSPISPKNLSAGSQFVTQSVPFKNLAPVQDKQVVESLQVKQSLIQGTQT